MGLELKNDFASVNRKSHKLLYRNEMDYYNKFNRFGVLDPYSAFENSKEYIFFTKPDLQLLETSGELKPQLKNNPFFIEAKLRYPNIFKQLQSSINKDPFIKLLSNTVTSSVDLPSVIAEEVTNSSNIYGDTISYRWHSSGSNGEHEFSLEFDDDKYLEVYHLFKVWDKYCNEKTKGNIRTPEHFVLNKILHDQISIYKIIVGDDRETILFYAKLTGVYPKNVPREAFSSLDEKGGLKLNVNFKASFIEDMHPEIIDDFNELVSGINSSNKNIPIYNKEYMDVNGDWVNTPYIVKANKEFGPGYRYKLKWR